MKGFSFVNCVVFSQTSFYCLSYSIHLDLLITDVGHVFGQNKNGFQALLQRRNSGEVHCPPAGFASAAGAAPFRAFTRCSCSSRSCSRRVSRFTGAAAAGSGIGIGVA